MEKKTVDSRKIVDAIAIFLVFAIFIGVVITNAFSNRVPTKAYSYSGKIGTGNMIVNSLDELNEVGNISDDIISKYDEKFFKKKSLVIYYYSYGYTGFGQKAALDGVYKEDGVLLLDIVCYGGNNFAQVINYTTGTFLIEVKKSDIKGVTSVKALRD
ncbi:MAG: hypothetical protein J1F36_04675 [Clostridiales bacterium]|nr:hypothetical protein [Clostridiales bacterium]